VVRSIDKNWFDLRFPEWLGDYGAKGALIRLVEEVTQSTFYKELKLVSMQEYFIVKRAALEGLHPNEVVEFQARVSVVEHEMGDDPASPRVLFFEHLLRCCVAMGFGAV
jgi:hypothetical protein